MSVVQNFFGLIKVLYEDDDILVLDKPMGLVVTPGPGYTEEHTLVGWLIQRFGEDLRKIGTESHRPGIVHRLDKDTSGVIVTVKTQAAFEHMVAQFKTRKVSKEYVAWLWGDVQKTLVSRIGAPAAENGIFSVNVPIGRNPRNRMRFIALEEGKPAITEFKIKQKHTINEHTMTLVHCYPKTGRTHQIRVHAKTFEHGIVGDLFYQSKLEKKGLYDLLNAGWQRRLYLHAHTIEFEHPHDKRLVSFTSNIPPSFHLPLT